MRPRRSNYNWEYEEGTVSEHTFVSGAGLNNDHTKLHQVLGWAPLIKLRNWSTPIVGETLNIRVLRGPLDSSLRVKVVASTIGSCVLDSIQFTFSYIRGHCKNHLSGTYHLMRSNEL